MRGLLLEEEEEEMRQGRGFEKRWGDAWCFDRGMTLEWRIESQPEVSGVDRNRKSRGDEEREIRKSPSFASQRRRVWTGAASP